MLERELATVRAESVAFDRCETFAGVVGVASPILSPERFRSRRSPSRGR